MSEKIGFWPVFALVTGSQIGSGVFMLPTALAPYGLYSLAGWTISALGSLTLALVFAQLCAWFTRAGGPHVYVKEAFGPSAAFFTGWTYWVISWVSTTVVIIASIGYLSRLFNITDPVTVLCMEIILLVSITLLNLRGAASASRVEFLLTVLKIAPLVIVPLAALLYFNSSNFVVDSAFAHLSVMQLLSRTTLLTLWGFIGLESATASVDCVENPSRTIPRAVVAGTLCVALLYLVNSLAILGLIPGAQLMNSSAPYADATEVLFGGNWYMLISLIASIICIGTLNAWTLASGQISLGLAQDGLMPAFFARKNRFEAPQWGLILSSTGIAVLLLLTSHHSLANQVLTFIDFSVTAFLFVYTVCSLAFLKLILCNTVHLGSRHLALLYGSIALAFCCAILYFTDLATIGMAGLFVISGLPLFVYSQYKRKRTML